MLLAAPWLLAVILSINEDSRWWVGIAFESHSVRISSYISRELVTVDEQRTSCQVSLCAVLSGLWMFVGDIRMCSILMWFSFIDSVILRLINIFKSIPLFLGDCEKHVIKQCLSQRTFNLYVMQQFPHWNYLRLHSLTKHCVVCVKGTELSPEDPSNITSSTNSEVLWWGRMTSQTTTHFFVVARNQWTSHKSLGLACFSSSSPLSWSVQFHTPPSNSRSEGERMTHTGICPHFSLKCANTITLGLS